MTNAAVFLPATLGILLLVAGIVTYREDVAAPTSSGIVRLTALGPVFVAAALAAFAGEHFTAASTLADLVPKYMPKPLYIAYFVGAAHLAAAVSFVARRYLRLSSICLALMFALFVSLMDIPAALAHPGDRMAWVLVARQATFSIGALALFGVVTSDSSPNAAATIGTIARMWAACVLVFYGVVNILYPQFSPGVPDTTPTAAWVPSPHIVAYGVGGILVLCGVAMFIRKSAPSAGAFAGLLMTVLAVGLYGRQFFIAGTSADKVIAINFIFDTLLFGGMILIIGAAAGIRREDFSTFRPPRRARSEQAVPV